MPEIFAVLAPDGDLRARRRTSTAAGPAARCSCRPGATTARPGRSIHQQLGVRPDLGPRLRSRSSRRCPTAQPSVAGADIRLGDGSADVLASHDGDRYTTVVDTGRAPVRTLRVGHTLPRGATVARCGSTGAAWATRTSRETNRGARGHGRRAGARPPHAGGDRRLAVELEGRAALVTGAAAGTGGAIAHRLAAEGAVAVLADVDAARGEAAARAIEADGGRARFVHADVADAARRAADGRRRRALDPRQQRGRRRARPAALPRRGAARRGARRSTSTCAARCSRRSSRSTPMRAAGGGAVVNVASTAGLGWRPTCRRRRRGEGGPDPLHVDARPAARALRVRVNCVCRTGSSPSGRATSSRR